MFHNGKKLVKINICVMKIDSRILKNLGLTTSLSEEYKEEISKSLEKCKIENSASIAYLLTIMFCESSGFRNLETLESSSKYEWRKDLGNFDLGDGEAFKGRGLIKIIGRNNYRDFSAFTSFNFIAKPYLITEIKYSVLSSCWIWSRIDPKMKKSYDDIAKLEGNFFKILYGINGNFDNFEWKLQTLKKAYIALDLDFSIQKNKLLVFYDNMKNMKIKTDMQKNLLSSIKEKQIEQC